MGHDDIKNLVLISEDLATAGQPTADQLGGLAREGFEVVVNLALTDSTPTLSDERVVVESLGLTYHHIPVVFDGPTTENLRDFFRVMKDSSGKKVFVHCAANYRVACFVALYGQTTMGWSLEEARKHIGRLWEPNEIWTAFLARARGELGLEA